MDFRVKLHTYVYLLLVYVLPGIWKPEKELHWQAQATVRVMYVRCKVSNYIVCSGSSGQVLGEQCGLHPLFQRAQRHGQGARRGVGEAHQVIFVISGDNCKISCEELDRLNKLEPP